MVNKIAAAGQGVPGVAPLGGSERGAQKEAGAIVPTVAGGARDRSQVQGVAMAVPGAFDAQGFAASLAAAGRGDVAFRQAPPMTPQECFQAGASAVQQLTRRMANLFLSGGALTPAQDEARRDVQGFSRALSAVMGAAVPRAMDPATARAVLDQVTALEEAYAGASALAANDPRRAELMAKVSADVARVAGLLGVAFVRLPEPTPADNFQAGVAAVQALSYKLASLFDAREALNDSAMDAAMRDVQGLTLALRSAATALPPGRLSADQLRQVTALVEAIDAERRPAIRLVNPRDESGRARPEGEVRAERAEVEGLLKAFKSGVSQRVGQLAASLGLKVERAPAPTPQQHFQTAAGAVQQLSRRMANLFLSGGALTPAQDEARRDVQGFSRALSAVMGAAVPRAMDPATARAVLDQVTALEEAYAGASALAANDPRRAELMAKVSADVARVAGLLGVAFIRLPEPSPAEHFQAAGAAVQALVYKLQQLFEVRDALSDPVMDHAMRNLKGLSQALREALNARPPRQMPSERLQRVNALVEAIDAERRPAIRLVNPRNGEDRARPEAEVRAERAEIERAKNALKARVSGHVQSLVAALNGW